MKRISYSTDVLFCKSANREVTQFTLLLTLCCTTWGGQQNQAQREEWNLPVKPLRIAGSVYYVGAAGVSAFLIADPQGLVLLDGGLPETADQIEKNVARLGFKLQDVRYLINSHAHFDHCGGLSQIKKDSGASLAASEADRKTLESGRQEGFGTSGGVATFPPVTVDRVTKDGDQIRLGAINLTAVLMPGHTKGCTSWLMPVKESGTTHQVIFHCSATVAGNNLVHNTRYPGIVGDYEHTFAVTSKIKADIFLAPHPEFFHMAEKRQRALLDKSTNPFIDTGELQQFNESMKVAFERELAKQKRAVREQGL